MKVFIMNGVGGSGKTTIENTIKQQLFDMDKGPVYILSIIDSIKELVKPVYDVMGLNPFTMYKTSEDRKFLSDIKLLCQDFNDYPFRSLKAKIDKIEDGVVFIDMREPDDIDRFIGLYGSYWDVKTVLVKREEKTYGNVADDNVNNYDYDIVIDNTGSMDDLIDICKNFIERYIKVED